MGLTGMIGTLLRHRAAGIAVKLVVFTLVVGAIEPRFISLETLRIVMLAVPLILVAAMGQMMVLVARHVDLSIGSMLGFTSIVAGMTFRDFPEIPWWMGFFVATFLAHQSGHSDPGVDEVGIEREGLLVTFDGVTGLVSLLVDLPQQVEDLGARGVVLHGDKVAAGLDFVPLRPRSRQREEHRGVFFRLGVVGEELLEDVASFTVLVGVD